MTGKGDRPRASVASEGDVNLSPARQAWLERLDQSTRALLDEDAEYFLRQSLSTPCLDVIDGASGAELIAHDGRRYLDFHGNSVHQLGHGHPRVVAAIKAQLDLLPFSPRRFTNRPASLSPGVSPSWRPSRSARCCSRRAARRRSAWR